MDGLMQPINTPIQPYLICASTNTPSVDYKAIEKEHRRFELIKSISSNLIIDYSDDPVFIADFVVKFADEVINRMYQ